MRTLSTASPRRDPFDSMFDEFLGDAGPCLVPMPAATQARMDVVDKGPSYAISIEMRGVRKEEIHVLVDGANVSITAEPVIKTPLREGEKLVHSERSATGYARSFELPTEVTDDGAQATYENGVLTLTLPKRASMSRRLTVH